MEAEGALVAARARWRGKGYPAEVTGELRILAVVMVEPHDECTLPFIFISG